jgi:hypothetical protein
LYFSSSRIEQRVSLMPGSSSIIRIDGIMYLL